MTKETPKKPSVGRTFGISDSLMNARPIGDEETNEAYTRPEIAKRDRKIARKSDTLRSKDSVASSGTTRFKQRHGGKTVPTRPGTQGMSRGTGVGKGPKSAKRPIGGMSGVHYDLTNKPEDHFRRKYGKSKSAMRTGLRKEELEMSDSFNDYKYNHNAWAESLSRVGKPKEELIKEESITVINMGSTYKVKSVSKDLGSKVRVGETLTDTHIDDLREMGINISYVKESNDMDTKNADKAMKHDCATHVVHKEHGEGQCVPGMHTLEETSEGEGYVTHYDVMFESGIIEDVPVKDLQIVKEMSHGHAKKKTVKSSYKMMSSSKKMNEIGPLAKLAYGSMMSSKKMKSKSKMESVDLDAKNVEIMLRHDCASHVKHGEFGEGVCVPGQHTLEEISEGEGMVTHYDVMFESGIIEDVPVYELEIITESMHAHVDKKKKKGQKNIMGSKKLDPVGQADADIDNDGDTDSSDEYLHKRRKAIKKNMKGIKEWVSLGQAPEKGEPKNAMHAHSISKHFYQMAVRDDMFGKEAQFKENMGLAKKFYSKFKEMSAKGDVSADQVFKDGSDSEIENFNQSETSQTNEALTKFGTSMDKQLGDKEKATFKAQGTIKMRKSDGDGIHGTTVSQSDTAKIAALKAKGYVRVSEDATDDRKQEMIRKGAVAAKKEKDRIKMMGKSHFQGVNDRKNAPKAGGVQNEDFREVQFEGETIYESIDSKNLPEHAPEVVEHTPNAYSFNRNAWGNALAEVNRYKNKSGHRVTQPDKSGEHIVMQLRKAVSVGANHTGVKFKDGETHKVNPKTAQKHLDHYNSLKPEDKIKWQNSAAHSHGGLASASGDKKKGQEKTSSASGRDEPTRRLINPMDRN